MLLNDLSKFCEEANESNSTLKKIEVIKKYPQCKPLWVLIYDVINYKFGLTSANLKKNKHLVSTENKYTDIQDLLLALSERKHTGHEAISVVNRFVEDNEEHTQLIYNILDRNLKTRTDAKLLNRVFPKVIPTFEVALAKTYKADMNLDFKKDTWLASHKLDGCRCLVFADEDLNIKIMSRTGNEFLTLDNIRQSLLGWADTPAKKEMLRNKVFDGEICLVDDTGKENFKDVMKYIHKKNYQIAKPKYCIFDLLTTEEFENRTSKITLVQRLATLSSFELPESVFSILEQRKINSLEALDLFMEEAREKQWEGLMLRKDTKYAGKRSKDLLKLKDFSDAEYFVQGIVTGPIRYIDTKTGIEVEEELLSKVIIHHKGSDVGVGSGFSLAQRKLYHDHPEDIMGKTITVTYFEESEDENGKPSLRFPTLKHIYEEARAT